MAILTGIECLRHLAANVRRDVNFDALLTEDRRQAYETDPKNLLLELATTLGLEPELIENSDLAEVAKNYQGPLLLQLKTGSWVCVPNSANLVEGSVSALLDPSIQGRSPLVQVKSEQVLERVGGCFLIFRQFQAVDNRKHSGLFALAAIARHHNVTLDLRQLLHDYAVGEEEVKVRLLREMASDAGLKSKKTGIAWKQLEHLGKAYPCIGMRKDGKYAVLCGMRQKEDETQDVVVVDPEYQATHPGEQFEFLDRAAYEEQFSNQGILLKRIYKLSDEEQPFGLLWFIPEFIKLKGVFGQIALAVVLITLLALLTPLFFQIVVDKVLVHKTFSTLNVLGCGIALAVIFNSVMEYLRGYLLLFATNKIDISTATKTFTHLMHLPIDFFERIPSGVLLKHMQQTEKIRGFLSGNLFFTVLELFSLVIFIPFLLLYSIELTLVVLGFSLLMAIVIALLIGPFQRRLNELYMAEGKRQSRLVESIHGVKTVKSLALEPVEEKAWGSASAYAIKSYFRVGKISLTARTISQALEMLMTIAVIWIGALLVFNGKLSVGALIAFQMLSGRVTGPLVKLVGLIHEYQQIALSVRMLGVVMNTPVESSGGGVRQPIKGHITFEDVSFRYRPDLPDVIKRLTIDIQPGTSLGIVGRSGSGKTTLTKLLQGLYPPHSGLVKIDGIDIREFEKSHLRSNIGVVLQDNYFFSGSVRENICLTKPNASLEEIIYASKLAGADEFVQKLQQGYDTMLEENASNLSGGQKQRLAIARALLTNPPVLIFDEATSALDPESETIIQRNLAAIAKGRTVLIISHRLSMVVGADNILVMNAGTAEACAPHRTLLAQEGIYKSFWEQQMGHR